MDTQGFDQQICMSLGKFVTNLQEWVRSHLEEPLARITGGQPEYIPSDLKSLQTRLAEHFRLLWHGNRTIPIAELDAPLLKRAILYEKRVRAERAEHLRSQVKHAEMSQAIDLQMTLIRDLQGQSWFRETIPMSLPSLTDYVTLSAAYGALGLKNQEPEARYDDKFGFLYAQSEFLPRLSRCRTEAWLRSTHVSAAFVDIDKFKAFNSKHTETVVDREMLPKVMQEVEAHIYSHGWAYRFGGDEYVIILPNADENFAASTLSALQKRLAELRFFGRESITVSVGICGVGPGSSLTDQEILSAANAAERRAKAAGGNYMAVSAENERGDIVHIDPPTAARREQ